MISALTIIVEQSFLYMPLLIGAYISISLLKVPDLSIESAYVFGAITGAQMATATHGLPLGIMLIIACIAALIGGMCVGATSSMLTRYVGIPHLLSSLVTAGFFHGANQLVLNSAYKSLGGVANPLELVPLVHQHPEFIVLAIIFVCLLIVSIPFFKTQLSYAYAIYGNNPFFFKHYRINTNFIFISGIMLSNALAGLSGYLFAQSNGFVDITIGYGKALLCITALMMGKTLIRAKKPCSFLIPIAGTLIYFALQQILLKIGFNLKYFTAVQAIVVLMFLVYNYSPSQRQTEGLGV